MGGVTDGNHQDCQDSNCDGNHVYYLESTDYEFNNCSECTDGGDVSYMCNNECPLGDVGGNCCPGNTNKGVGNPYYSYND